MLHVLRMVDRNAREPFECGNGNIIIVTFTANGRIRIEAFKNRILQHYLSFDFCFSFFVFYLLRFCFSYCGARRLLQCYLVTAVSAGVCDALLLTRSKAALASLYGLNRASQTPARNAFALRCVALHLRKLNVLAVFLFKDWREGRGTSFGRCSGLGPKSPNRSSRGC